VKLLFVYGVASGLRYLHYHNIIHRDLKPANVLIVHNIAQNTYSAKISDFGISTSVGLTSTRGTAQNHGAMGTSAYMAPELFDDELSPRQMYTPALDIYAFGILANEVFSGRRPWEGKKDAQIVKSVFYDKKRPEPMMPDSTNESKLLELIGDATKGCLHQDPTCRPKDVGLKMSRVYPSLTSVREILSLNILN
jgi:hypothetical protein